MMNALQSTQKFNGKSGRLDSSAPIAFHGEYKKFESEIKAYGSSAVDVFNLKTDCQTQDLDQKLEFLENYFRMQKKISSGSLTKCHRDYE